VSSSTDRKSEAHRDDRLVEDVAGVDGDTHSNAHGDSGHEDAHLAALVAGGQLEDDGGERLRVSAIYDDVIVVRVLATALVQGDSGVVDNETWLVLQEHSVAVGRGQERLHLTSLLAIETFVQSGVGGHHGREGDMAVKSL